MVWLNFDFKAFRNIMGESDEERLDAIRKLSTIEVEKCEYVPSPKSLCTFKSLNKKQAKYYVYYRSMQLSGQRARSDDGYVNLLTRELLSTEEGMREMYRIIGTEKKNAYRDRIECMNQALAIVLDLPFQYTERLYGCERDIFLTDALLPRYHRLPARFLTALNCNLYHDTCAEWLMDALLHQVEARMKEKYGIGLGD